MNSTGDPPGNETEQPEQALREVQEAEDVAQWIRAYTEHPQTEKEFGWADVVALEFFREHEWIEQDDPSQGRTAVRPPNLALSPNVQQTTNRAGAQPCAPTK